MALYALSQTKVNVRKLISLVVYNFAVVFCLGIVFFWSNTRERIVARSIKEYPNSKNWEIQFSNGFPDSRSFTEIKFSSNSTYDDISNYYKDVLTTEGWTYSSGNFESIGVITNTTQFSKTINGATYIARLPTITRRSAYNVSDPPDIHYLEVIERKENTILGL